MPQALQIVTERPEVVDLAVESAPDRAGLVGNRLITGFKVDNAEAPDAQREEPVNVEALTVGAAMAPRFRAKTV